jgi:hypothetical protein
MEKRKVSEKVSEKVFILYTTCGIFLIKCGKCIYTIYRCGKVKIEEISVEKHILYYTSLQKSEN